MSVRAGVLAGSRRGGWVMAVSMLVSGMPRSGALVRTQVCQCAHIRSHDWSDGTVSPSSHSSASRVEPAPVMSAHTAMGVADASRRALMTGPGRKACFADGSEAQLVFLVRSLVGAGEAVEDDAEGRELVIFPLSGFTHPVHGSAPVHGLDVGQA